MSKPSNRNSSSLRFLWIPGRKKHHHKGRYDTVHKASKPSHHQKHNEPWSLGGNKGHEELIKTDISGEAASTGAGAMSSVVVPATCAVGTSLVNLKENSALLDGEHLNGDIRHQDDNNPTEPTLYNTETLIVGSKQNGAIRKAYITDTDYFWYQKLPPISSQIALDDLSAQSSNHHHHHQHHSHPSDDSFNFQKDLDTIEQLDETTTVDGKLSTTNLPHVPDRLYNKTDEPDSTQSDGKHGGDSEDKDEKTVKCLYYALMCCECTIS